MSELCKQMAMLGKGLGNENRFTILQTVMKKPRTVGEIAKLSRLPQPAVSQHLKVLKSANLVESERKGQEIRYLVNASFMTGLLKKLTTDLK
jgi:DNA-binding transcriptional ArsR family regulator